MEDLDKIDRDVDLICNVSLGGPKGGKDSWYSKDVKKTNHKSDDKLYYKRWSCIRLKKDQGNDHWWGFRVLLEKSATGLFDTLLLQTAGLFKVEEFPGLLKAVGFDTRDDSADSEGSSSTETDEEGEPKLVKPVKKGTSNSLSAGQGSTNKRKGGTVENKKKGKKGKKNEEK